MFLIENLQTAREKPKRKPEQDELLSLPPPTIRVSTIYRLETAFDQEFLDRQSVLLLNDNTGFLKSLDAKKAPIDSNRGLRKDSLSDDYARLRLKRSRYSSVTVPVT